MCVCGTLLVVEALYRLSCDLLLVKEDLQLRSLCLCLHSRQFLTATQHTGGQSRRKKTRKITDASQREKKTKVTEGPRLVQGFVYLIQRQ